SVMDEMGKAMMGTGEGQGEERAVEAAERAIANPLLDELSLKGAKGVLINITGGYDLTLFEMDEAANRIRQEVDEDANIIVGSTLDPTMEGFMRVSVVATGIDAAASQDMPVPRRRLSEAMAPVETQAAAAAAVAPVAAEVVAAAPEVTAPAEVPQPKVVHTEPSFFDAGAVQAAEEQTAMDDFFGARQTASADDDLPPPAYQPAPTTEPMQAAEPPQASFTAPRPGTPTPEAMERLRAAVLRGERRDAAPTDSQDGAGDEQAGRFGISSLINRMTGSAADTPVQRVAPPPRPAAAPPMAEQPTEEDERIEIPAFLRRQAN
ncbi:MAG: cell division protein FtsZ, partial [Pseudomonadota bacterium]